VALEDIGRHASGGTAIDGLVLGYGMIRAERIDEALGRLVRLDATRHSERESR